MGKTIIKEIGIVILILVAVVILLCILFYAFKPNNKIIPARIKKYILPEEINKELQQAMEEEQTIERSYYIDSLDLNKYELIKEYDKGKANPFADYSIKHSENNIQNNNTNKNNNSDKQNINNENNSEPPYFNTHGQK